MIYPRKMKDQNSRNDKNEVGTAPVNEATTFHREDNLLGPSFLLLVFAEPHTSHNSVDKLLVRRISLPCQIHHKNRSYLCTLATFKTNINVVLVHVTGNLT